jgi:hypothetical protein
MPWHEALAQPGADQMRHGRALLESRPVPGRSPDDTMIVEEAVKTAVPGAGRYRLAATRGANGAYAFVYTPSGRPFSVRMDAIDGPRARAWWFDPRTGRATPLGEFETTGTRRFTPPDPGEMLDWVLVLDDARRDFPAPGSSRSG